MISCMRTQRTVRQSHKLALYRVQSIQDSGTKFGKEISVVHDPLEGYECHALIKGIDPNVGDLLELIAAECISMEAMLT